MTSYPCPFCHAPADLATGCSGCGRPPDPDAAEVIRLDVEIPQLRTRVEHARGAVAAAEWALRDAGRRRDEAAGRVRATVLAARPSSAPAAAPLTAAPLTAAPLTAAPQAAAPQAAAPQAAAPAGAAAGGVAWPATVRSGAGHVPAETSTRTVQNLLFLLGGLLLGTAAVVFTAVAWATYGVGVRAAVLATVTLLALGLPLLALRRGLRATAETFAAVGLLLVLLDGYAAWYVNLFGVAGGSAATYAGVVCAVTAAVAVGYGAATGLRGPRFAALLVAQPVLPLLLVPVGPDATGWALALITLAALNLAVLRWPAAAGSRLDTPGIPGAPGMPTTSGAPIPLGAATTGATPAGVVAPAGPDNADVSQAPLRALAWLLHGGALALGALSALAALFDADGAGAVAGAGGALVAAAVLFVFAGLTARLIGLQAVAAGSVVVAIVLAAGRFAATLGGAFWPVLVAGIVTLAALAVAGTARWLPPGVRPGPGWAALAVVAVPALVAVTAAVTAAGTTLGVAHDLYGAGRAFTSGGPHPWQIPVSVALLTVAVAALLGRDLRVDALLAGAALVVLAVPATLSLPWWMAPVLALLAASALAAAALVSTSAGSAGWRAVGAGVLVGDAVLVGLARSVSTAAVLAAVTLLGVGTAVGALWVPARRPAAGARRLIGGLGLFVGLLAWPGALAGGLAAVRVEPWWVARAAVVAVAVLLPVLAVVRHRWPGYRGYAFAAVLAAALPLPIAAVLAGGWSEPSGGYAAVALLLIGAAVALLPGVVSHTVTASGPVAAPLRVASGPVAAAGAVALFPGCWLLAALAPGLSVLLVAPYGWLDEVWSGRPAGVGLSPFGASLPDPADAPALAVLALALLLPLAGRLGWRAAAGWVSPLPLVAVPLALAAAGVRWPVVPAASLLCGLGLLLAVALRGTGRRAATVAVVVGSLLVGSGLAGGLPTRAGTLAGWGLTVVVATVAGAAGRTLTARLAGWLAAVGAATVLAVLAGLAAELAAYRGGFGVLGVAALALLLGVLLGARRPVESVAVQAAAHGAAVTALLLALPAPRYAAAVCTLWGVALGLRAMWPGERGERRRILVVAAASVQLLGWWLLLAAGQVAVIEAYTVPAGAVALLAGWLASRGRPGLSSWLTHGPALAAVFLPSLASVLVQDGQPVRRLLLGTGALVVVLAGAAARRQAPVLVAGGVLVLVALHELLLVWDLLPRWIPLAAGGLLLVGLAMTLERRRRDMARMRAAVTRMT